MLTPIKDSIIVKQDEAPGKIGSIIVPDYAKKRPLRGTVLAVGKGIAIHGGRIYPELKAGDKIIFEPHSALDIRPLGPGIVIMRERDVLGVLE